MEATSVQKIARVLNILLTAALLLNLLVLLVVPTAVVLNRDNLLGGAGEYLYGLFHPGPDDITAAGVAAVFLAWFWVWHSAASAVTCFMLLLSGGCTAVILWQGRRVLRTILSGEPFSMSNAVSLRRAAVSAFCIAAAALLRLIWGFLAFHSLRPLASYNALFIPIFAMFGLLCLVMSALFRQAAELKAENDLTI